MRWRSALLVLCVLLVGCGSASGQATPTADLPRYDEAMVLGMVADRFDDEAGAAVAFRKMPPKARYLGAGLWEVEWERTNASGNKLIAVWRVDERSAKVIPTTPFAFIVEAD